jgi:preprotein translocase subunit SecE
MAEEKKNWIQGVRDYYNELRMEMRRVTWPNRKQVEGTTAVVIVSVFAFAAYFFVVDSVLQKGITAVLSFFKTK